MKIAVTYENGQVFQHFGHCETFKLYEAKDGKVVNTELLEAPAGAHCALGGFLKEKGVEVLICGGIGGGARNGLAQAGIELYPGTSGNADEQVSAFLSGSLNYDPETMCTHHDEHHGDCHGGGHSHTCGGH